VSQHPRLCCMWWLAGAPAHSDRAESHSLTRYAAHVLCATHVRHAHACRYRARCFERRQPWQVPMNATLHCALGSAEHRRRSPFRPLDAAHLPPMTRRTYSHRSVLHYLGNRLKRLAGMLHSSGCSADRATEQAQTMWHFLFRLSTGSDLHSQSEDD